MVASFPSCARLRFKASIRLMTLGGSAIARGVVATSPFVFASTSSQRVLISFTLRLGAEPGRATYICEAEG